MPHKPTITIGIPAYNSASNIKHVLNALGMQKNLPFVLKEILVYVDGAKDATEQQARSVKNKKITVVAKKLNKGMAYGFEYMIAHMKGNIFVLLNDDIKITDPLFLKKLLTPLMTKNHIGLMSGNPQPFGERTFIEKAASSTFRAYETIRYSYKNGNNKWTCDGKVLVLTESFLKQFSFPKNRALLGNIDIYLYFSCLSFGLSYRHVRSAIVYFKFPSTITDYSRWNTRNNTNQYIVKQTFGNIVEKEYHLPTKIVLKSYAQEVLKNPLGTVFIKCIGIINAYQAKKTYQNFTPAWTLIESTKL